MSHQLPLALSKLATPWKAADVLKEREVVVNGIEQLLKSQAYAQGCGCITSLNLHRKPRGGHHLSIVPVPQFTEKDTADQRHYVLAEGHTVWTFKPLLLKVF